MKISSQITEKVSSGNAIFQYLAMVTSTFSIIASGMHYGWPSPSLPRLFDINSTIPITNAVGSWLAVMPLIGAVIGAIVGAAVLDIIGRKKAVLITSFPFFISWIMIAYSSTVNALYVARFIAGLADGLTFTAVPMYIGEIAEPRIRGFLGSSCSFNMIFGILLINVIGSYFDISTTALISSVIPILLFVTFIWMPESPYYSLMKQRTEEAKTNLKIFRGTDDIDVELHRLNEAVQEQMNNTGKVLDLFTRKSNRRGVFIMAGLRGAQQFSGTTAITFYAKTIFQQGSGSLTPTAATTIYFCIQLTLCCFCSVIVDKTGRRPLLIISMIGSAITLFTEGTYFYLKSVGIIGKDEFSFIPVTALISFVIIFSIGMQSIPIILLGELFPTNVKAFALSLADIYYDVAAIVVSKFFQITKDNFGIHVPFFAFTGFSLLGLLFIVVFVPETKGKTLEDIQDDLKKKSSSRNQDDEVDRMETRL